MKAKTCVSCMVYGLLVLLYTSIAYYYYVESEKTYKREENQLKEKILKLREEYNELELLSNQIKENSKNISKHLVEKILQKSHTVHDTPHDALRQTHGALRQTQDELKQTQNTGNVMPVVNVPPLAATRTMKPFTGEPSVLVVGGTDGSGTRRVVQVLTSLGTRIVSEDPETYDIHADLVGGWPAVVTPVLEASGSITYSPGDLPSPLKKSTESSLRRLLARAEEDSHKPTSNKLAVGGALPIAPGTQAHRVKFGFKAPVAMTLLPWWAELNPHFMFLHVLRDGRDIAFSANQGPVDKFYGAMYRKTPHLNTREKTVKAIRLWGDWNNGIRKWAEGKLQSQREGESTSRSFGYHAVHIEDLVDESKDVRFMAIKKLADFVGSDLDDEAICCLAVEGSNFMGSHDRKGKAGVGGEAQLKGRYGKWKQKLAKNPRLEEELMKAGGDALKELGYMNHQSTPLFDLRRCSLSTFQCNARKNGDPHWKDATAPSIAHIVSDKCSVRQGVDYRGGDLSMSDHSSLDQCCSSCASNFNCRHFTYDPSNEVCYLKSSKGRVLEDLTTTHLISGDVNK